MNWKGKWKNQYGSVLEITDDTHNQIKGFFKTAIDDSGFYGQNIAISGSCQGDCIGISGSGTTKSGDALVTYTGLFRDGKMETLWYVVADATRVADGLMKNDWWRAMITGSDTFERVN